MTTKKTPTKNKSKNTSKPKKLKQDPTVLASTSKGRIFFLWSIFTTIKLSIILLVTIGIYSIYLDSKLTNKFEGHRWQVPIQVFGEVISLKLGENINSKEIKQQLLDNNYQEVPKVIRIGQFAMSSGQIVIHRRSFDFGYGTEAAEILTLNLSKGAITQIFSGDSIVEEAILEPILIDRIVPQSKEDRILLSLEAVPEQLIDTLLLVEDRDYYHHAGVSPFGILRALYKNLRAGRTVQGGSTLTQQLVKNMFLTRQKTLWRKVNEALMALILEYRYSKDQLLEAYLNEVYLGQNYANGIYGFGLAANFYFNKNIADLSIEQMAMLVGQVKGPSYYDPWRFPKRAKHRRDLVLQIMFQQHLLSRIDFEQAISSPLNIRKQRRVQQQKYPAYIQLVKHELNQYIGDVKQQTGIRVFTGFSKYSQDHLQATVTEGLTKLEKKYNQSSLQAAMIVTDIKSGQIRAMVGDKKPGYAGFNRALNAQRPIGSLIKPSIYLAALERFEHYNLATVLEDKAIVLTNDEGMQWRPKNYDGKFRQQVSLNDSLVLSLNIPTVNLGMKLGLDKVIDAIKLQGYQQELTARPSLLLGAINMSPIEVNQLYLPLALNGRYQKNHAITKIISPKAEVLWQFTDKNEQRFSTQASYLINHALNEVTTRGTARSLSWRIKNKLIAGKTGTSNDLRDSWFIGYDKKHLVTSWIGKDNNGVTNLTGSSGALVLFADFMNKQGTSSRTSVLPDGMALTLFEEKTGHAVTVECENIIQFPAIKAGTQVMTECLNPRKNNKSWFEKLFGS